jgi:hypothetical protein
MRKFLLFFKRQIECPENFILEKYDVNRHFKRFKVMVVHKIGLCAIAQPSFTHCFLLFFIVFYCFFGVGECKAFRVLLQA